VSDTHSRPNAPSQGTTTRTRCSGRSRSTTARRSARSAARRRRSASKKSARCSPTQVKRLQFLRDQETCYSPPCCSFTRQPSPSSLSSALLVAAPALIHSFSHAHTHCHSLTLSHTHTHTLSLSLTRQPSQSSLPLPALKIEQTVCSGPLGRLPAPRGVRFVTCTEPGLSAYPPSSSSSLLSSLELSETQSL